MQWLMRFGTWPETTLILLATIASALPVWRNRHKLAQLTDREKTALMTGLGYIIWFPASLAPAHLGLASLSDPRYLLPALVGFVLVVAIVAAKADDSWVRLILWTLVLLLVLFQAAIRIRVGPWIATPREDWRNAIAWIEQRYHPGDIVLLHSGLVEAKFLAPDTPGAQAYLAAPLSGFYNRLSMDVINLPWNAEELTVGSLTPPEIRERARQAPHVLVLMRDSNWNWSLLEGWMLTPGQPPRKRSVAVFQIVEARAYEQVVTGYHR